MTVCVEDGVTTDAFCDLSHEDTLFDGSGDPQFEVYRQMKLLNGYFVCKYIVEKTSN